VANLLRNQEVRESTIDATAAVVNEVMLKPGTTLLTVHNSKTFIKKAANPKVMMEMGSAINWKIGRINVFTIPITTAATIVAVILAK